MRVELPDCKRCCCCIPLRFGLIFWGYTKLVTEVALATLLFYTLFKTSSDVAIVLSTIMNAVDLGATILLLVAAHKKHMKLLKVYYRYSVVESTLVALLVTLVVGWLTFMTFVYDMGLFWIIYLYFAVVFITLVIICIALQIYIILLLRSEIMKLKNLNQFRFVNNAVDHEATCNLVLNSDEIKSAT